MSNFDINSPNGFDVTIVASGGGEDTVYQDSDTFLACCDCNFDVTLDCIYNQIDDYIAREGHKEFAFVYGVPLVAKVFSSPQEAKAFAAREFNRPRSFL